MDPLMYMSLLRARQTPGATRYSSLIDPETGRPAPQTPMPVASSLSSPIETKPKRSDPYDLVTDDERKRARAQGLMQAGIGLLSTAGMGDYTGGLSRAFQGFGDAQSASLRESQGLERQHSLDERTARQDALQEELAKSAEARAQGGFEHQKTEWGEEDQKRARNAQAAQDMVAAIDQAAGAGSPESKRAHALLDLGEDADVARLAALHDDVVTRQRLPADTRQKSALEIEDAKARIKAGVAPDPAAAERRANEGMSLERLRTGAYVTQTEKQLNRDPKPVTPQQLQDDVASEAQRLYQQKLEALKLAYGEGKPRMERSPAGKMELKFPTPFNATDLSRIRREADQEAELAVKKRYQMQSVPTTGAGLKGGVYRFDAQGNLLPQ